MHEQAFLVSESDRVDPYGQHDHTLSCFFFSGRYWNPYCTGTPGLGQRILWVIWVISLHVCCVCSTWNRHGKQLGEVCRLTYSRILTPSSAEKPQGYFGKLHRLFIASSWQSFTQARWSFSRTRVTPCQKWSTVWQCRNAWHWQIALPVDSFKSLKIKNRKKQRSLLLCILQATLLDLSWSIRVLELPWFWFRFLSKAICVRVSGQFCDLSSFGFLDLAFSYLWASGVRRCGFAHLRIEKFADRICSRKSSRVGMDQNHRSWMRLFSFLARHRV